MNALGDSCCVTGNYYDEIKVMQEAEVSIKMGYDSS